MASDAQVVGYRRPSGKAGARDWVLVLPSVVCAALVAERIATASGAISISHQDGCAHLGVDVERAFQAFTGVASNPNVASVLVVSLGCETVRGGRLSERIASTGQRVTLVGIQESGGLEAAHELGMARAREMTQGLSESRREAVGARDITLGIVAGRDEPIAEELIERGREAGARVVVAAEAAFEQRCIRQNAEALTFGQQPASGLSVIIGAGSGAQRHVAVAAAGAQVAVAFPGEMEGAMGTATCPVVNVPAPARIHVALADDFDVPANTSAGALWHRVLEVFSGMPTSAERVESVPFALPRLTRTA